MAQTKYQKQMIELSAKASLWVKELGKTQTLSYMEDGDDNHIYFQDPDGSITKKEVVPYHGKR
jgi:hypothetical protein